jgi:flagellar biosynthesis/type III secretory pathway protein FliH
VSTFEFVKPKSESKDAVRKAEAKAQEIAKLAEFADEDLIERKQDLLRKGDNKSLNEAKKLNAEVARRNASAIDAEKAELKALVDKINARVKELAKAGTPDSIELLTQVAMTLG